MRTTASQTLTNYILHGLWPHKHVFSIWQEQQPYLTMLTVNTVRITSSQTLTNLLTNLNSCENDCLTKPVFCLKNEDKQSVESPKR